MNTNGPKNGYSSWNLPTRLPIPWIPSATDIPSPPADAVSGLRRLVPAPLALAPIGLAPLDAVWPSDVSYTTISAFPTVIPSPFGSAWWSVPSSPVLGSHATSMDQSPPSRLAPSPPCQHQTAQQDERDRDGDFVSLV